MRKKTKKLLAIKAEGACCHLEKLSPETIKDIERALEDIKKGKTYSTRKIKKKLGIE